MYYPGGVLRGTLPVQRPGWARLRGLLLWRLWQNFFQSGQTKTARVHSHGRDSLRVLHYRLLTEIKFIYWVVFIWHLWFSGCDKKFTSKFKLKRHILIHSQTKTFLCDVCHRAFRRKDHLKNHEKVKYCMKELLTQNYVPCIFFSRFMILVKLFTAAVSKPVVGPTTLCQGGS